MMCATREIRTEREIERGFSVCVSVSALKNFIYVQRAQSTPFYHNHLRYYLLEIS